LPAMNRNKTVILAAFLLLLIFAAGAWAQMTPRTHDGTGTVTSYTREDVREKWRKKFQFDYKPYLSGEKKLGFFPDEKLYKKIYYYITLKYVDSIDNDALLKGVKEEVKKLLVQAKVDPAGLDGISRGDSPMDSVVKAFGSKVDPDLLRFACLRGMLEALNDPHTVLMLPDDYDRLKENMAGGNFFGIGVFIMLDPDNYNWLTVSEAIEGTPAYEAGLKPGDIVTAIDGETTKGQPIDLAVSKIRGTEGSAVKLTIKRKGEEKPFDVSIRRAFIHVNSVKAKLINGNVGYIKLRVYGSDSGTEIEKALTQMDAKGVKYYILDLRNNSGGLIDASVDVCSKFLPRNLAVVSVVSRSGNPKVLRTNGGRHTTLPMVVLVNELSASASEITAGCLKDHKRATLIGERTFGKGSVQELMPIRSDGDKTAALKLTIALFYTPNNVKINKVGLEPDVKVPMDIREANVDDFDKDLQLQRAVKFLQSGK